MVIPPLLVRDLIDNALPDKNRQPGRGDRAASRSALAFADAMLSLLQRYLSSRVGEGLIYDLRVALFDHVQRMPLAFFTRTQTGALQSRLNNDVIGAQQAVTTTLGTVVSNVINLAVVLTIMLQARVAAHAPHADRAARCSSSRPAGIGPRMQKLTREGMQLNAEMNNLTVERFNVAGAMLAKLFGKQDDERDRFATRAAGVRDIGVRTAIYGRILFVALGLVAAVGTAVVYFVGGNLAISGTISHRHRRRVHDVRRADVPTARAAHELARRHPHRARVVRAGVRGARLPGRRSPTGPARSTSSSPQGASSSTTCGSGIRPAIRSRSPRWKRRERPGGDEPSEWILRDVSLARRARRDGRARRARRARARRRSRCSCRASTKSRRARSASTATT